MVLRGDVVQWRCDKAARRRAGVEGDMLLEPDAEEVCGGEMNLVVAVQRVMRPALTRRVAP
jgi:hypothetical protein